MLNARPDWLIVRRPGSPVLFFICMLTILAIGWRSDLNSCVRSNAERTVLRTFYVGAEQRARALFEVDIGVMKTADLSRYRASVQSVRGLHPLACDQLFPPTR